MTTTTRHFYAISYIDGRETTTTQRNGYGSFYPSEEIVPAINIHRFASPAAARRWVGTEDDRDVLADAPATVRAFVRRELRRMASTDYGEWCPGIHEKDGEVLR
jgi:hypothetical protein